MFSNDSVLHVILITFLLPTVIHNKFITWWVILRKCIQILNHSLLNGCLGIRAWFLSVVTLFSASCPETWKYYFKFMLFLNQDNWLRLVKSGSKTTTIFSCFVVAKRKQIHMVLPPSFKMRILFVNLVMQRKKIHLVSPPSFEKRIFVNLVGNTKNKRRHMVRLDNAGGGPIGSGGNSSWGLALSAGGVSFSNGDNSSIRSWDFCSYWTTSLASGYRGFEGGSMNSRDLD